MITKFILILFRGSSLFVSFSFARKQIFYANSERTFFFLSANFKLCGRVHLCFSSIKFHFRIDIAPGTAIKLSQESEDTSKKVFFVVYIHHMVAKQVAKLTTKPYSSY